MNTSIKVLLYTSKKLSNGEHPVMLRITKNRKSKYISTGFKCSKDLWDSKTNFPKKKHPLYVEAKLLISSKIIEAEKYVYELENENKNSSALEIKNKLKKAKNNNPLFFDYVDLIIERLIQSGDIGNSRVYKDARRTLLQFTKNQTIHFSEIDITFLNKFEEHLKSCNKGLSSISLYLRTLRSILNKAIKENVCSEKYYPFKHFKMSKYNNIKTEKRAITKEEILKIKNIDLTELQHLVDAKNIFMFSYYCRGMNFIDIAFLKWKDIKKNRLVYTRKKIRNYSILNY